MKFSNRTALASYILLEQKLVHIRAAFHIWFTQEIEKEKQTKKKKYEIELGVCVANVW